MAEQSEIVEKRIQRTVIRRRVVKVEETPESALPEDVASSPSRELSPETVSAVDSAATVVSAAPEAKTPATSAVPGARTEVIRAKSTAASLGLSPEGSEVKKPIILGTIDLGKNKMVKAPAVEDEDKKLLLKKVVKKKTRAEEDIDIGIAGVGRISTLGQLTRLTQVGTDEEAPVNERVFRPSAIGKKKRVIGKKSLRKPTITMPSAAKRTIKMGDTIEVAELAKTMGIKAVFVLQKLTQMGLEVTAHDRIDSDAAGLVATEFNFEIKKSVFDEQAVLRSKDIAADATSVSRPPVITVMGHVDHGKTSLLDAIRQGNVAAGEAGGITQHIGAYSVTLPKGKITFLDTPGHEAFTAMRARGASATDIVILVVAADEGVRPQTIESIRHAQAAKVPIIVAINKMDKEEANPDRVKRELSEHGLVSEEWGGDVMMMPVSAHKKEGIIELLEAVLLQAEVLELKADPKARAEGIVVEARLDKGRGPIATVLVKNGTLRRGDAMLAGTSFGRVRAMTDYAGKPLDQALPSDAVEILGLGQVPSPGDAFTVVKDEKDAKLVIEHRVEEKRKREHQGTQKLTLENWMSQVKEGNVAEFKVIIKSDVQGSVEAVKEAVAKLATDEVKTTVIQEGVGAITESDIMLASASGAIVIGFNVRPETKAIKLAEQEKVEVKLYRIIYELLDDLKLAMQGLLAPATKEVYLGRAEVRDTFTVSKVGLIAGCFVVDGKLVRNAKVRLLRDNVVIADVQISSLKRFKEDAREVAKGFECGVGLEGYSDIKPGDVLESYQIEDVK